ncbi:hypothetical protein IYZ83_003890 [Wolbachia pipientis]|uniref:hypothetical protein n=1 Tax=Wolbachia pipientis TaxID=955 RepID=UPI001F252F62|nr:hypothetical protein [Wolbachia pipientis]UIP91294.1 hypothetical protein IYZ83_003890 [Wolbachia pipientis]
MFVLFFFIPYFHPLFSCFSSGLKMYLIFFIILSNVHYFPLTYITPSKGIFFFEN